MTGNASRLTRVYCRRRMNHNPCSNASSHIFLDGRTPSYSRPACAWQRGGHQRTANDGGSRLFQNPVEHIHADESFWDSPVAARVRAGVIERIQKATPNATVVDEIFSTPTTRAAKRGQSVAEFIPRSGLIRLDVPMSHIQPSTMAAETDDGEDSSFRSGLSRSTDWSARKLTSPSRRLSLRDVVVPEIDTRGVVRSIARPTAYADSKVLSRAAELLQPMRQDVTGQQSPIARVAARTRSGSPVSNRFSGGLRSVPTSRVYNRRSGGNSVGSVKRSRPSGAPNDRIGFGDGAIGSRCGPATASASCDVGDGRGNTHDAGC